MTPSINSNGKGHDKEHGKGHGKGHGQGHSKGHGKGHGQGHGQGHDKGHDQGHGKSNNNWQDNTSTLNIESEQNFHHSKKNSKHQHQQYKIQNKNNNKTKSNMLQSSYDGPKSYQVTQASNQIINKNNQNNKMNPNEFKINQYTIFLKFLGKGAFGTVYKAYHKQTKKIIAVKCLNKYDIAIKNLKNQINMLQKVKTINRQNIVQFLDYQQYQKQIHIFFQLCDLDLHKLIELSKRNKQFTQDQCIFIIMKIFQALLSLYESQDKIIHRDIKPANILIKDGMPKIGDLGLAKQKKIEGNSTANTGTLFYMPPQLRQGLPRKVQNGDVFSLGCVFYQILNLYIQTIHRQNYPPKYSRNIDNPFIIDYINHCVDIDYKTRSTYKDLLQHKLYAYYKQLIQPKQQQILKQIKQIYKDQLLQNSLAFTLHSQIITNDHIFTHLLVLFQKQINKTIKFEKVFKASDNEFKINNFYNKCGNMDNILILVQTTTKNILGGYSSCLLMPQNHKNKYSSSQNSFIFSLTNQTKFELNKQIKSNKHKSNNKFICFGEGQMIISDQGNQKQSQMILGKNIGENKFIIKQWEAYQVIFG